jgi:hypothetical protein
MPDRGIFRATTDQMFDFLEQIEAHERAKQESPMGSPEFVQEARDVERLSRLVFRWAQLELQMAQEAEGRVSRGESPADVRLTNVQPRPLDRILANWREAQLRLEIATPGSDEAQTASEEIERLREEYQVAHEVVATKESPAQP